MMRDSWEQARKRPGAKGTQQKRKEKMKQKKTICVVTGALFREWWMGFCDGAD
jgi:hypothetical protein